MRVRNASLLAVVIGLGLLASLFAPRFGGSNVRPSGNGGVTGAISVLPSRIDRPAAGFTLPLLLGGGTKMLASLKGRVVVLNFWASWCVACRAEAPELEALWRHYRGLKVVFLGVDVKDTTPAATAFVRKYGVTYQSVVDRSGSAAAAYGIFGLPDTYIVDPKGTARYVVVGAIDPASFRTALDRVVAGQN